MLQEKQRVFVYETPEGCDGRPYREVSHSEVTHDALLFSHMLSEEVTARLCPRSKQHKTITTWNWDSYAAYRPTAHG